MKAIQLTKPETILQAARALQAGNAVALAGGMDLVPSLQDNIVEADRVVNLKTIEDGALRGIRETDGGLVIGALTTLSEIADDQTVQTGYAALAEAASQVGSPQIRNVGTLGGNLCQRPRCWYFRHEDYACLKKGGSRCYAKEDDADNEFNAILGGGPAYIVHPSNYATALVALSATIGITGPSGSREVASDDFFVLPSVRLTQENVLDPGEIVSHVTVPQMEDGGRSTYVQFAHKRAFDWAVSGAAVAVVSRGGRVVSGRIVLHAVAPVPWRATTAETILAGSSLDEATRAKIAETALDGAEPLSKNAYKVPLTKAMVREALARVA